MVHQTSPLNPKKTPARTTVRAVALPAEHGGWGFLLEPLLLGLLVVPSLPGLTLTVAVVAAFLLRQPTKIAVGDWQRGRTFVRTRLAWRFVLIYSSVTAVGLLVTAWMSGFEWLIPPLMALPFGLIFLYYDFAQPGRSWQAEITAPVALASAVASMALIAGGLLAPSLALWGVVAARAVPAVLYVRARLRLDRGKNPDRVLPIAAHAIALLVVLTLIVMELLPWLTALPFVLLLARAVHGLSAYRWRVSVKALGFSELGLGIGVVLLIAIGYWLA